MELPVSCTELWRCFNIHVPPCNEQVESNVSVSHSGGTVPPVISIQMGEHKQTWKGVFVMYEFHGQLGPAPMGEEPCGWRDTITGGSGESGETLKKLFLVCIIKFSPFPDAVQIHGISSRLSARQNRSVYNLPISHILRFPRQSSFILCTFQSRNLLSYTNKRS